MVGSNKTIDATPEKRIFLSIISEYDLRRSMCELIDNAMDLWAKTKRADLVVKIEIDLSQQTISIEDNAGGIEESRLDHIVSPGKTSNDIRDDVIGFFGVGSKRAVVALAQDIAIHSRFEHERAFAVHLDEHWISDDPDWHLPYAESRLQIAPYSTVIRLSRLRSNVSEDDIQRLKVYFGETYAKFIERGASIVVNDETIKAIGFDDQWRYPPNLFPTQFSSSLQLEDRVVQVEIVSGLIDHPGDPDNSYGVFVYCNGRLIARGLTDFSVGFSAGQVGNPHYNISLVRTIVRLRGQSQDMPWDSSKSGIDQRHPVYKAIRQSVIDATKRYAQVSRSLQGRWDSEVFPHAVGHIQQETLDSIKAIPKSYLPKPPTSKQRWRDRVADENSDKVSQRPWCGGLLDSIIAADLIFRTASLTQKNRIALLILDSTLEIAYKEYLVHEKNIGASRFASICGNRADVEKEVAKALRISKGRLQKINHYYKIRCDLVHQRATPNVSDSQIEDYRELVEALLTKMFKLDFQ